MTPFDQAMYNLLLYLAETERAKRLPYDEKLWHLIVAAQGARAAANGDNTPPG